MCGAFDEISCPSSVNDTFSSSCDNAHLLSVEMIPLPVWFRLDRHCSWREFGSCLKQQQSLVQRCVEFADLIAVVDWNALEALKTIMLQIPPSSSTKLPIMFLNFRVFHCNHDASEDDVNFYRYVMRSIT